MFDTDCYSGVVTLIVTTRDVTPIVTTRVVTPIVTACVVTLLQGHFSVRGVRQHHFPSLVALVRFYSSPKATGLGVRLQVSLCIHG